MSSESQPISPIRFREALKELPIGSLHTKAAELKNSIAHLRSSNEQLKEFADAGDRDCEEAIAENAVVMARMEERIAMLKEEVEDRGLRWYEDHEKEEVNGSAALNGESDAARNALDGTEEQSQADGPSTRGIAHTQQRQSGRLTDEELQRLLAERLGEPEGDQQEEGVYL